MCVFVAKRANIVFARDSRGLAVDSRHSSVLQAIPDQVNFYIILLFAIEIPLRSQLLPSGQAQRFCAKGWALCRVFGSLCGNAVLLFILHGTS